MILVDTSIWVDHLRAADPKLLDLLDAELVSSHPWIAGELACGKFANREAVLFSLRSLPQVAMATPDEVLHFIAKHNLAGKGVGYIDMHLLASAALSQTRVWSRDRRMSEVASTLGLNAEFAR